MKNPTKGVGRLRDLPITALVALAILLRAGAAVAQAPGPEATPSPEAGIQAGAPRDVSPQSFRSPADGFAALIAALRSGDNQRLQRVIGWANIPLVRDSDVVTRGRRATASSPSMRRRRRSCGPPQTARCCRSARRLSAGVADIRRGGSGASIRRGAAGGPGPSHRAKRAQHHRDATRRRRRPRRVRAHRWAAGAFRAYARDCSRPLASATASPGGPPPDEPAEPARAACGRRRGRGLLRHTAAATHRSPSTATSSEPWKAGARRARRRVRYVVNGRMIGGWAVIASPYRYGSTGIMTFMISHHGDVWQANLGPETAPIADGIDDLQPRFGLGKGPRVVQRSSAESGETVVERPSATATRGGARFRIAVLDHPRCRALRVSPRSSRTGARARRAPRSPAWAASGTPAGPPPAPAGFHPEPGACHAEIHDVHVDAVRRPADPRRGRGGSPGLLPARGTVAGEAEPRPGRVPGHAATQQTGGATGSQAAPPPARAGGRARGAAAGATAAAITGNDAGKGAAAGAVGGAAAQRGARRQDRRHAEAQQQQAGAAVGRAMAACMQGRGYTGG